MGTRGRVAILGLNYAPEPTGNAPYTTSLARHLARAGHTVTAITAFPHYPQWRRYPGFRGWRSVADDHGVLLVRLKHWIPRPPRGVRRLASELSFGVRLAVQPWKRPDAVVMVSPALFSTWLAMVRLLVQRAPRRIVWVQDLYSQGMAETGEGGAFSVKFALAVEAWTLRRAHTVVAIHETMAARITASLRVDRDRVVVIPNWSHVVPATLSPRDARDQLGWPQAFTVLHSGNMGAKQGLEVVVSAAQRAQAEALDARFVLLGDGGERAALEESAHGTSALSFVDPLDDALFPVALAAADVLLVTEAVGVAEMAAPSKLTSYFAAQRPVVASVAPAGIVARIMGDAGAGPVVAGGDAAALLDALTALAKDPAAQSAHAHNAHDFWQRTLGAADALAAWERVVETTILGGAT